MRDVHSAKHILSTYLLVTYIALLVNILGYLRDVHYAHWVTKLFIGASLMAYGAAYLVPVALLLWIAAFLLISRKKPGTFADRRRTSCAIAFCLLSVFLASALQVGLYADRFIFHIYGFHLNGFVLNLVFTRGGIESLGSSAPTTITFILIILGIVAMQAGLFCMLLYAPRIRHRLSLLFRWRMLVGGVAALLVFGLFGQVAYGVSFIRGYTPILFASNVFPLYVPITFSTLAEKMGMDVSRPTCMTVELDASTLVYPLKPIQIKPPVKPLNIVFLIGESLRWDMLSQTIMPSTWALAQKSLWCRQHYSGGNGTRMAMFSLFSGLYGSYWFTCLGENRGAVLIDVLLEQKYQIELFTSAGFSYPEFDQTIFSKIDPRRMHERNSLPQWRCDQNQITALLESIDKRDPALPFMTFMFFESPHANYHFPPDAVIVEPYAKDLNYATMDLDREIGLIKNRYINACHHMDMQVKRVIDHLEQRGLMDSTIVMVTGDHGEEFMEKGRWGHNSTFSEEQTRSPFVLWVPGKSPRAIDTITSHLDMPATLMPLLGVTNPSADHSCGIDLYGDSKRTMTILADWSHVAYVTPEYKVVFSVRSYGFDPPRITTKDDVELPNPDAFFDDHKQELLGVMRELKTFEKRRGE